VACSIYKLAHGANFLICSNLFDVGKSTIYLVFHEVVYAINKIFKGLISWPKGDDMQTVMIDFQDWHGLLSMQGAIDGTHVSIAKPLTLFAKD
jgi:hypothetical protein